MFRLCHFHATASLASSRNNNIKWVKRTFAGTPLTLPLM
jgi:hypothetical protein